jgi:hypothetical protein
MFRHSEKIDQIHKALKDLQMAVKHVQMDGKNPHFKSKFATMLATRDALPLEQFGLTFLQTGLAGGGVTNLCIHDSGQWIEGDLPMPMQSDPQKQVANYTYGCRKAASMFFFIVGDEDCDGESLVDRTPQNFPKTSPKPPQDLPKNVEKLGTVVDELPATKPSKGLPQTDDKDERNEASVHKYAYSWKQEKLIKMLVRKVLNLSGVQQAQEWLDSNGFGEAYGQVNTIVDMNSGTAKEVINKLKELEAQQEQGQADDDGCPF